jgi:hypothetical protein
MKLYAEIPKFWLKTLSPLFDGDFALAQLVLEDTVYADFYAGQSASGRFVILDNGFHELGHPLSPAELTRAADLIHPSVVIAPDKLGDYRFTLDSVFEMRDILPQQYDIGAVLCGVSPAERADFFMKSNKVCKMLCLPFRENRFEWFCDLMEKIPKYIQWPPRLHLLGVNELWELKAFRDKFEEEGIPSRRVSVDTSKMIKFGILHQRLSTEMNSLRGTGRLSELEKKADSTCMTDVLYNIAFLRKYL